MLREHAAHDVFVNIEAKTVRDLFRDAHTTELWIAPLHFHDGRDELRGRPLRPGLVWTSGGGEEPAVLAIDQGLVELEHRGRFYDYAQLRNAVWSHEQGGQPEHQAIGRALVRCSLSGTIAHQQLMFERQRFRGNSADATRAKEFRQRDEQVYRQKDQIARKRNVVLFVTLRKTVRR